MRFFWYSSGVISFLSSRLLSFKSRSSAPWCGGDVGLAVAEGEGIVAADVLTGDALAAVGTGTGA